MFVLWVWGVRSVDNAGFVIIERCWFKTVVVVVVVVVIVAVVVIVVVMG